MYIKYQETPRTAFFKYIPINARLSGRYLLGKFFDIPYCQSHNKERIKCV